MSAKFKTVHFICNTAYEKDQSSPVTVKPMVYNVRKPDLADFSTKLQSAYETLDRDGFDVVNVVPIAIGTSEASISAQRNYLGDMGFSPTFGAVVIGRRSNR